jgi:hypothetical protein
LNEAGIASIWQKNKISARSGQDAEKANRQFD